MNVPNIKDEDCNRIAIVVVGYNRLIETKRLLKSLNDAYYESLSVPLVISIDASGNEDLYDYVKNFVWEFGNKYVIIQTNRLGLREHILQCGDLTEYFKGVIILEDDLFVSPYFYRYAIDALNYYQDDDKIAGISLYSPATNAFAQLPFITMQNGKSVYAYQDVATWGELFNKRMWYGFRKWLKDWNQDFSVIDMPNIIKSWSKAWSKFFYSYIIETDRYFIFPYVSLTTNFNDSIGEHGEGGNPWTQYSLMMGYQQYNFAPSVELVRYDVYCHNYDIYDWIGYTREELEIDLYGIKGNNISKRYLLSISHLPYHEVKSFALSMRPIEMNIKYEIDGVGIFLYDTNIIVKRKVEQQPYQFLVYMLQGFKPRLVFEYTWKFITRYLKQRLFR